MADAMHGVFPFGEPVCEVKQIADSRRKRVFVLGVYASAVHACWKIDGKVIVRALAVASEPCIFWKGEGAQEIISRITVPKELGTLTSAGEQFNGPSGKALDEHILNPLDIRRDDAWLCDLRPWSCSNAGQADAIRRYHKQIEGHSMPHAVVERADDARAQWADRARQVEILAELQRSEARVLITLGDQPLRHFVHPMGGKWSRLGELEYGRFVPVTLGGLSLELLPLAHPRQIAGLGTHSAMWRAQHEAWKQEAAAKVSDVVKAM